MSNIFLIFDFESSRGGFLISQYEEGPIVSLCIIPSLVGKILIIKKGTLIVDSLTSKNLLSNSSNSILLMKISKEVECSL